LIHLDDDDSENIYPKFYASGLEEDSELCYIMSFIKLKENEENNDKGNNKENNTTNSSNSENEEVLNNFIIFDYLGIWDIVVLASLEYKKLKDYKDKFLINESLPIAQTSSIILIPVTEKDLKNNIG
jgi:hypothetical protein